MIILTNVVMRRGPNVLLQDVNWTIYHKQRFGIIGANGSGKSTLFSMFLGELHADSGNVEIPKQIKLAHVAQETPALSLSALDFVLDGDDELRSLQAELAQAEKTDDGHLIATLHARLGEIDAYTAGPRAAQLLAGLGFSHEEQLKSVSEFSGGWRVRLNLAKALMCRSDVLLLDEPTNHLDLDAVIWLQNWLIRYPGTLLLISHDRDFLDSVVDHIAHVHQQALKVYAGNYSSFEKQRVEHLMLQQAAFEKQQRQVLHLQSFINRFKAKASKARQAQSRVKALERMELVSAVQTESAFQFSFKEPKKCPNPLIYLEDAKIAYGDKVVLSSVTLQVSPKDRIALIGPNGAGKSSLIKLLAGELSQVRGERVTGDGLKIGYFAQHQVDHLELAETPLFHLRELAPGIREQELRSYLGTFGFTGDEVLAPVGNFSGGEKSRLALALLVWQKPNLLLLDEPTNHLDLEMRQALSLALQEYTGAMIIVSHDRFLLRSTVDQLMLVANHEMKDFEGDLDDYERWLFDFRKKDSGVEDQAKVTVSKKEQRQLDAEERERRKPLVQKVKKLEEELDKLQKESTLFEAKLSDESLYDDKNKILLKEILFSQSKLSQKLQEKEDEWLQACERLEAS